MTNLEEKQKQDYQVFANSIQYCSNLNHLTLQLNFKADKQFIAELGKSLQNINQIKNLNIQLNRLEELDFINQEKFIELSKGISNQQHLTILQTNLDPINNWRYLNSNKEIQELSIVKIKSSDKALKQLLQIKEQEQAVNKNVYELIENISQLTNIQILNLSFPSEYNISNQCANKLYEAVGQLINLTNLHLSFQFLKKDNERHVFFGNNLQNCKELKEIDLQCQELENKLEESEIALFSTAYKVRDMLKRKFAELVRIC